MNRLRHTFEALSVRNFRLFAAGQLLSVTCTWMMIVAQDWLVLSLSGDSGTALGVVTALQFSPMLLLTLYGGRLADRHDKRVLLISANIASGVLSLLLALAVLLPGAELWHVYLFALALGMVNAVEVPTRLSFVSEMVGGALLPNASALSAAYFNAARVVGPALAGVLISGFGTGPVVLLNAVSYLATVISLLLMRPSELHRGDSTPRDTRIVDGLRYVGSRPDLLLPMVLVAVIGMFGFNFQLTLPLLAKTVFHADSASFGLLASALAAGSLLAAFATTARRGRPSAALVVAAAVAFGLLETLTALAPTFPVALIMLAATGFATITFAQATNHRIQLGSDPQFRGRVMALYALILQGTTPVGALLLGWVAERWGARVSLSVGGLVSLAAALAVLAVHLRRRDGTEPPRPAHLIHEPSRSSNPP
ncbi:MFS transporter [Streptomyces sp. MB09-01]|uniref:MFS transporter n=1 Tax=Streptomyces sp. MB09-01 TaxID=3028666 RepID=UPI0029B6A800|nr:MFS transporter [Streptomyces sp. MB09-01]MDX3540404.1 MFS transporter [Streptomyces sp. MB09-01]